MKSGKHANDHIVFYMKVSGCLKNGKYESKYME